MNPVPAFRAAITKHLATRNLSVSNWNGGTRKSDHLLDIGTAPSTILYVKSSANNPGFWGLTKNQLDQLSGLKARWFCVFLHQSSSSGYVLSGGQVQLHINDGSLKLAGDGDYKINERAEFVVPQRFDNLAALFARVL